MRRGLRWQLAAGSLWAAAQAAEAEVLPVIARLSSAPVVDGIPDDRVWQEATLFDAFLQASPNAGAVATQRTELRVGHDGRMLYVAVRAFDKEPARIVAQQMRRDSAALLSDDHVLLVIDVEGQGRNGFALRVNPNGTQYDALVYDGVRARTDWDALWQSEARIDDDGWTAEIAIPLSALGVRPGDAGTWRFNAQRWMPGLGERVRLAAASGDKEATALGEALRVTGAARDPGGLGLRVKPSLRLTHRDTPGAHRTRLEPGLELFHQSDNGLRTTAAFNLDFGEAESDERVVNLTRFPLFMPEKREFFLQDAGRFSFGGLSESPLPFFSRRVGIGDSGAALSLDAGLKMAGTAAGVEFGAFAAQVAKDDDSGQPSTQVGVVRAARGLGERGRLGMIATAGNPQGSSGSHLWGLDYQWQDTRLFGSRTLEANVWMQESVNAGIGSGQAWGVNVDYPNEGLTGRGSFERIDAGFLPALGFLSEAGVSRLEGEIGWWHFTESGGHVIPGVDFSARRTLDGRERSSMVNPELSYETAGGDFYMAEVFYEHDRLATGYELLPGLPLAAGDYRWHYLYALAETSSARPLSASLEWRDGGFYDGTRREQTLALTWKPGLHWTLRGSTTRNAIVFDAGRFVVRSHSMRIDHTPSNRWANTVLVQWDNVSRELGVMARVRWTWAPGRELLLALDHLRTDPQTGLPREQRSTAMLKGVWNFEP